MKLYIKNKLISLKGASEILNENKEPVYKVEGKLISPTKKKTITDMEGNVLYIVRNKYWRFFRRSCLIYDKDKNKIAKIVKKFFSIGGKFWVEGYKDEIKIEGGWKKRASDIIRNGEIIGTVRREFDLFKDSFVLDAKEDDIEFLMALVIAIDNIGDAETEDN